MIFNKKVKSVLIGLAVSALVFTASLSVMAANETGVTLGDVNGDNSVNIKDVTLIQKVIAKLVEEPENFLLTADVNCDDTVNIKDATIIQKYIAKIYKELPVTGETEPETEATTASEQKATDPQSETTATQAQTVETKPVETTATEPQTAAPQPTEPPATQPVTDEWDPHIWQP